jgi:hypothetical protein
MREPATPDFSGFWQELPLSQKTAARFTERRRPWGGADKLKALIPPKHDAAALAVLSDDRALAEMAKRIFTSFSSHSAV